jgi:hypothetical protein
MSFQLSLLAWRKLTSSSLDLTSNTLSFLRVIAPHYDC